MKKYINQDDMKNVNLLDIFKLIKELGQTTRKQIESITNMSWGAVSNITARLIERGLVVECKAEKSSSPGRTPSYLMINGNSYYTLGLDINMTGMKAELVNIKNNSVKTWNSVLNYSNKEILLKCILDFIGNILSEITSDIKVIGIGIAMQGVVDADKGISVKFPVCSGWENVPLAEILQNEFNLPVWLEHDPNCILLAYAENHAVNDAILLRIDKGIGMSLMLNGLIIGRMGMFEVGQILIDGSSLEEHSSITGMENTYRKPFATLVTDAASGIPKATCIFDKMGTHLATSIYNIQKLFNVSTVILCGEIMKHSKLFMDKIELANPKTQFSIIDVSCASYGAAIIAADKAINLINN